jgi:hypothetical protein
MGIMSADLTEEKIKVQTRNAVDGNDKMKVQAKSLG